MRKGKYLVKDILIIALGLIISGFGIGLIIIANLGGDPASVFHMGVSSALKVSYGTAAALVNFGILAIVFFVDKSYINISSFMAMFLIGYTADLTSFLFTNLGLGEVSLLIRYLILLAGIFFMTVGINMYILVGYGVAAIDMAAEIISDKTGYDYDKIRIVSDVFYVVVGYLLGGKFGFGTMIAALFIGPFIKNTRPAVEDLVNKLRK